MRLSPLFLLFTACSGATGITPGPAKMGDEYAVPWSPSQNGGVVPKGAPLGPAVLIPGDVLDIKVFRQPDLELSVRIPPSGSFTYPLIGQVEASSRTPQAVEKTIRDRLEKDYLHEPQVTVTVKEYAKRFIYAHGGLFKPGAYEILPAQRMTVLQLISTAGGFTDRAYKEYAQLIRRNVSGQREVIAFSVADVEKAVAKGRADADLELQPEDLLVIPSAGRVVYVFGQVNKAGSFDLPVDTRVTVSMAISQAGSWTKFASISSIQVLRQTPAGEPIKYLINLNEVLGGKLEMDLELKPGDVIWVPDRGIF